MNENIDDQVEQSLYLMGRLADLIVLVKARFPNMTTEVVFDEILYCLTDLAAGDEDSVGLIGPVDREALDEVTRALVEEREAALAVEGELPEQPPLRPVDTSSCRSRRRRGRRG